MRPGWIYVHWASRLASSAAFLLLCFGIALWVIKGATVVLHLVGYVIGGAFLLNMTAILSIQSALRREECDEAPRALSGQYLLMVLLLAALCAWGIAASIGSLRFL